jgi:hypothetical protein
MTMSQIFQLGLLLGNQPNDPIFGQKLCPDLFVALLLHCSQL